MPPVSVPQRPRCPQVSSDDRPRRKIGWHARHRIRQRLTQFKGVPRILAINA
jgi:hypothetical protein